VQPSPIPVQVVSTPFDWLNLTSTIAGLVALGIAVAAYFTTRRQAVKAIEQAAIERRKTFELDVLRELLLLAGSSGVADLRSLGLLDILPGEFPLWRRLADVSLAQDGDAGLAAVLDEHGAPANDDMGKRVAFALGEEIRTAIEKRAPAVAESTKRAWWRRLGECLTGRSQRGKVAG